METEQAMKKAIRIIIPIVLALAIIFCTCWYLFVYDRAFTRDMLLYAARYFESTGSHKVSTMLYNFAYNQAGDKDDVAIELANQYKLSGNYTKAEFTLSKAISDGGGVDVYIALCKTYVEQDKLMDAVNMLNNITNKSVKEQLDAMRPKAPTCSPDPTTSGAYYTQYITVTLSSNGETLYASNNGQYPSIASDLYKDPIQLTDGENNIYAISVAENGLVSTAAKFSFTVGGVIEKVTFADPAMEAALREALGVNENKVLYTNDLWTITEFSVPVEAKNYKDLTNLAFLKKLTVQSGTSGQLQHIAALANLEELIVKDTAVLANELPIVGKLPGLKKLTLSGCSLSTASGLENAKDLIYLDMSDNAIRNLAPIGSLQKLQELNFAHNALNDLTALASVKSLVSIDVSYNNLTTVSPITEITGLKSVIAGNNNISELSNLDKLTAVEMLDLSYNTLTDVAVLGNCVALKELNISNNSVADISSFSALKLLSDLNFANNKVKTLPVFTADCQLVNIDGSYNSLKNIDGLKVLKKLNNVFMDYNRELSSIKALADCHLLIQVNVYGTKVRQVTALTSQGIIVNYNPT